MIYYSLNDHSVTADYREAVLQGQAPDKGLYFPETIPPLNDDFFLRWKSLSVAQMAYEVIKPYVGESIDDATLQQIVEETVAFDFPLVQIEEQIFTLELFHGPTAAFKDVGARFMSRCLRHFVKDKQGRITILVATSGDTGGAVADAFFDIEGIDVVILFPSGKVSKLQELQLTTYGKNVKALEVQGSFDDCQSMVKQAFADPDLKGKFEFSSANSINVARWLSQQFYYFDAVRKWPLDQAPVISVPSGNFGNICAGLTAFMSGLPVDSFVAACNENDVVTEFLETEIYRSRQAVATISNAMDVGDPSNFKRMIQLFSNRIGELKKVVSSYSFSDQETEEAIRHVFVGSGYTMDPHGAVGYLALKKQLESHPGKAGIFLETAHPAKFADVVEPLTGQKVQLPKEAKLLFDKKSQATKIPSGYAALKEFLRYGW